MHPPLRPSLPPPPLPPPPPFPPAPSPLLSLSSPMLSSFSLFLSIPSQTRTSPEIPHSDRVCTATTEARQRRRALASVSVLASYSGGSGRVYRDCVYRRAGNPKASVARIKVAGRSTACGTVSLLSEGRTGTHEGRRANDKKSFTAAADLEEEADDDDDDDGDDNNDNDEDEETTARGKRRRAHRRRAVDVGKRRRDRTSLPTRRHVAAPRFAISRYHARRDPRNTRVRPA